MLKDRIGATISKVIFFSIALPMVFTGFTWTDFSTYNTSTKLWMTLAFVLAGNTYSIVTVLSALYQTQQEAEKKFRDIQKAFLTKKHMEECLREMALDIEEFSKQNLKLEGRGSAVHQLSALREALQYKWHLFNSAKSIASYYGVYMTSNVNYFFPEEPPTSVCESGG